MPNSYFYEIQNAQSMSWHKFWGQFYSSRSLQYNFLGPKRKKALGTRLLKLLFFPQTILNIHVKINAPAILQVIHIFITHSFVTFVALHKRFSECVGRWNWSVLCTRALMSRVKFDIRTKVFGITPKKK